MELFERREILDARGVERVLARMAAEIVERVGDVSALALVGIRTRGLPLAERLRERIHALEGVRPPLGVIDITLYRDDVFDGLPSPVVGSTEIGFRLRDKVVLLVDDVLYTGRTVRAALDALMDFGRPRAVRLAVLCDRGGRELPIAADHVGISLEVVANQTVRVHLKETDGQDRVALQEVVG